ncbi:ABC transporter ATP-binding protein [Ferrovibrio sp.]|uniref:ABC transporter ATP-binding protein n=1 Tax=Ferrovibrio sp. TaxID=1917215 RepID=UPI0035AE42E5
MYKPGAHIQLRGIGHQYRRGQPALRGIEAEIQPCEAVALIGRSGCGKSTLLHIIAGLLKPAEGQVLIDGEIVRGPSPKWNMMFQSPSLYPWMSVGENAALGLKFAGVKPAERRAVVQDLLNLVQLGEHYDTPALQLSGGQQQRVALARSLATQPDVLLLDEPFSALDAFTRASLQRDVRRICRDRKITLVLVTHDIDEAVLMADCALVMQADPGCIAVVTRIDLPEERHRADPAVQAERDRLLKLFEGCTGEQLPRGGNDADISQTTFKMNEVSYVRAV